MSDWHTIDPRSVYSDAHMRTMEDQTLRAITRHQAGEPGEVIDRAKAILRQRHAPPIDRILDDCLSPYERELYAQKGIKTVQGEDGQWRRALNCDQPPEHRVT